MGKNTNDVNETFLALVNRHRAMLERVCHIYEDRAEERKDLFQEVVFQLWKSYPTFRGEATAKTWMYRVALNTAITAVRQQSSRPEHVELQEDASTRPGEASLEAKRIGRMEMLYHAIRSLNKVDRAVVTLYLEGFEYREISETLGLSETNVGVKLSRVRAKLQDWMRGWE